MENICSYCIHNCGQIKSQCINFESRISKDELKEINYELRRQNVNIHKLCIDNNLSYKYLIRALKNKMPLTYKQATIIQSRLNEKLEWLYEMNRWELNNIE